MSPRMVRVIALIWTTAALLQAASLALRVHDSDWGWQFWVSLVLLAIWICGAVAYWLVARRPRSPAVRPTPAPGERLGSGRSGAGQAHV